MTYDYWQTVELQGQPDPNGPWENTSRMYRIIGNGGTVPSSGF